MKSSRLNRSALSIGAAAALLAGCGGASQVPVATPATGAARLAFSHHMTFSYTGKKQTFNVPNKVTRIRVIAVGGNGGGTPFAYGGRVSAVIPVTPSETLAIYVGGAGTSSEPGFNGGGAGGVGSDDTSGNGGGGASDVREGGDGLKDRVVVAGGAGGSGTDDYAHSGLGGQGGALTGGAGKAGSSSETSNGAKAGNNGAGGKGGTQRQGGSGGRGGFTNPDLNRGLNGVLGSGGAGGPGCVPYTNTTHYCRPPGGDGGGGGGGFYGGGGGGAGIFEGCCGTGGGGGGGGGSSYVESTGTNVNMTRGSKTGQSATVVIYW